MPSTREIKRRIASDKNIQKITRAMEMVASVKMKKARNQILAARPYAEKLSQIATHLHTPALSMLSPLLAARPVVKRICLIAVSADKGLCGGFNAYVVRKTLDFIRTHDETEITTVLLGKKIVDAMKRRSSLTAMVTRSDMFIKPRYEDALAIGQKVMDCYIAGEIDEVDIIYNEYKGLGAGKVKVEQLLPVPKPQIEQKSSSADYIFEPDAESVLRELLPRYFMYQIWRAMLESYAAEQTARMAAMNAATKNAGELISKLTLYYNKARQGAITKELLEVVSGAEALK